MNKYIAGYIVFLASFSFIFAYFPSNVMFSSGEREQLKGCIKVPESITEDAPPFTIYFAGRMVHSDEDGFYTLPLDNDDFDEAGKLKEISMLISSSLECVFDEEGSTVKGFRINDADSYSYKKLSMKKVLEKGEIVCKSWNVEEQVLPERFLSTSNKSPFLVPERCIVIGLNPKYVEVEDDWGFALQQKFIQLPPIIVKESVQKIQNDGSIATTPVTKEKLQRCSDKAMCGDGMDLARFHTYVPVKTTVSGDCVIRAQE